ncbi:MAG: alpha/beta fold hydrolase [Qingshengfaniella sp.]
MSSPPDPLPIRFSADPPGLPPLLLVHGFYSSRNHWRLNLQALRRRYRIILAELPGHGQTPGCTDPVRLHPNALADTLDAGRRALGIVRWHICGQSFGAGLTLRHALRHPPSVGAQVWTNANRALAGPGTPQQVQAARDRRDQLVQEGLAALRRETFHPRFARRFPPDLREILARDADGCDLATIVALMDHTLPVLPLADRLADTTVPTLLINGLKERRFQPQRDLATRLLPQMEVVDLDGGHSINIEQPAAFDAAVLAFLARHDPLLDEGAA